MSVPQATCDDAELLISELVSNAVQHAMTPCRVVVELTNGYLLLEVADETSLEPLITCREMAESGRGIAVVDRVASDWGWRLTDEGKVVWIKLVLTGRASGGERAPRGPARPVPALPDQVRTGS